jgi:hypothetical protein
METFHINGIPYVESNDIPKVGDLFMTSSNNVVQATTQILLDTLVITKSKLIKPNPYIKPNSKISPYVYPGL